MAYNIQLSARKRIVGLFARPALERLSQMERPWLADTATLKDTVVLKWPVSKIEDEFNIIMRDAI